MTLKTKRRLRIAAVIGGSALIISGFGLMIKFLWKADDFQYEQIQIAKGLGYQEIKAQLKSDEVAKLAEQLYLKEIEPEEYIVKYRGIKEITQDEFMAQYASAEEQEKYNNLAEQSEKWKKISMASTLSLVMGGAVPLGIGVSGFLLTGPTKEDVKVEQNALAAGGRGKE